MSCIYLEITSGPAWGLMNPQTAGNSTSVFSTELSAALCLFIHCWVPPPHTHSASPQQQTCPARQQGHWICKGCIPPPPPPFHLQTRGSQSDCRREKPSPSQHGCCFRATPICCMHPDFPRSHWAIQEITADTEPFVSFLCSPLKKKKKGGV